MLPNIIIGAVIIIIIVNIVLILTNKWRWIAIAWAFQVFAIFWLTTMSWVIPQSAVKLVSGWIVIAVISASKPENTFDDKMGEFTSGIGFRFLSVGMTWLLAFSISIPLQNLIPTRVEVIWGGVLLLASGLLQIGLSRNLVRTIMGLLTFLGGFEIIYASIEKSVLVAGLLALVNIGLAWLVLYFLTPSEDEQ
jgi:hypothetical protein